MSWGLHITQRELLCKEAPRARDTLQTAPHQSFAHSQDFCCCCSQAGIWEQPHQELGRQHCLQSNPRNAGVGRESCFPRKINHQHWDFLGDTPQREEVTGPCSADIALALLECDEYSQVLAFPATALPLHTQSDMTPEYSWNEGRAEPGTATAGSCLITRTGTTQPWRTQSCKIWISTCTYRHVGACANKGVCHGIYQLPTDTKVTKLDFTSRVYQNVGWFHIWEKKMDDLGDKTRKSDNARWEFSCASFCFPPVPQFGPISRNNQRFGSISQTLYLTIDK